MSDALGFSDGLSDRWRGAVEAHKAHAAEQWPVEAVGLIDASGTYHACENVEPGTREEPTFGLTDAQLRAVDGGHPAAVLHSHTSEPDPATGATTQPKDSPSAADMQCQLDMGVPWGISLCIESGATDPFWFGRGVPRPPLYGRTFRHGVNDCYAFIRDWHAQVPGIEIPEFPRDADWWEPVAGHDGQAVQQNMYMEGFAQAGFKRVHRDAGPLPGDVFLCNVRSLVFNHGGVYVGNGLVGHHLMHQLSLRQPASIWRPKLAFLVRHEALPDDWEAPLE